MMLDESRFTSQARADLRELLRSAKPIAPRPPSIWATQERRIAAGQSPLNDGEDIPYSHDVMPHCVEPMDAADDPEVNVIVLWFAIRMGKTEAVCCNIIGRTVTDDPANILDVWPIEDSSDRYSRDVIEPMIGANPALSSRFVEKKSREAGRTIDHKRFEGGSLYIVNSGSRSKFRGMAAKVILQHEIDAYPVSVQGEGDPIEKAFGRAEGFSAIKVLESTGTIASEIGNDGKKIYHSNIEKWFDRSDQRKWFCPCRRCNFPQWLKFDQIRQIGRKSGELWFYLCEECDADHNEKQWRRMVASGIWKPTAPFINGVRGYWINGFNSLLPKGKGFRTKLHQFAIQGHRSMAGTPDEKRVWINEIAAELVSPTANGEPPPAWKPLYDAREDYGLTIPAGGLFLTAFVDCQLNRLEIGWRAWGRDEESWGMDHTVLDGHVRDREVWAMLRLELSRKWKHASGAEIRLGMSLVDGGHYAEDVYRFMQGLAKNPCPGVSGHCRASKGMGQHGHPIIDRKWHTVAKNLGGYHIGTWEAKDRIYERLRMETHPSQTPKVGESKSARPKISGRIESPMPERSPEGVMHFNYQFGEEYFQQLTVETVSVVYERGKEVRKYINPLAHRNEALDIEVGNLAAFRLHPHNFDTLERELAEQVEAMKAPPKPEQRNARPRRSFLFA